MKEVEWKTSGRYCRSVCGVGYAVREVNVIGGDIEWSNLF